MDIRHSHEAVENVAARLLSLRRDLRDFLLVGFKACYVSLPPGNRSLVSKSLAHAYRCTERLPGDETLARLTPPCQPLTWISTFKGGTRCIIETLRGRVLKSCPRNWRELVRAVRKERGLKNLDFESLTGHFLAADTVRSWALGFRTRPRWENRVVFAAASGGRIEWLLHPAPPVRISIACTMPFDRHLRWVSASFPVRGEAPSRD